MALVACVAALAMTGCKDKNEPAEEPKTQDTKPVAAAIQFQAKFDPLTIEMCDISFDYYDENGNKKNEVVTTAEWKKEVKSASLPATFGFHWNLAVKANLDESKYDKILVDFHFKYASFAINAEGAAVSTKEQPEFGNHTEMAIAKKDALVSSIMEHNPLSFVHKYDAAGKVTSEDWN